MNLSKIDSLGITEEGEHEKKATVCGKMATFNFDCDIEYRMASSNVVGIGVFLGGLERQAGSGNEAYKFPCSDGRRGLLGLRFPVDGSDPVFLGGR